VVGGGDGSDTLKAVAGDDHVYGDTGRDTIDREATTYSRMS